MKNDISWLFLCEAFLSFVFLDADYLLSIQQYKYAHCKYLVY